MPVLSLVQVNDAVELAEKAADYLLQQISATRRFNLCCATGATPVATYRALADKVIRQSVSIDHVFFFNLDEYVGMPESDARSCSAYIGKNVLSPLRIPLAHTRLWHGDARDPVAECKEYERALSQCGGVDCHILGLGLNGHIAFNEPGTPFDSRSHVIQLTDSTLAHNTPHLMGGKMPTHGYTVGIATIMDARQIVILVSGAQKAGALKQLRSGPITTDFPASVLRCHPNVILIADRAALGEG